MQNPVGTISRRSLAALATALLAASLAVAGCSAGSSGDSGASTAQKGVAADDGTAAEAAAPSQAAGSKEVSDGSDGSTTSTNASQSYIVRTATLTVEAKNVGDALAKARTLITGAGGYIGDETTSLDDEGQEHSSVQLKVPPEDYEGVLDDLAGLGKLVERKVNAQDVTGEVVDVESRIKSQQASVARVRELMDRAVKLSDIVTLEGELSTRQANLEALQAQQASLKERTSMATVTLVLTQAETVVVEEKPDDGVWASVVDALGAGWHAFYVTFRAILIALAAVLPFAVFAAVIWVLYRVARRRLPARERRVRVAVAPPAPVTVPAPVGSPREED